jgi:hypothetical protein
MMYQGVDILLLYAGLHFKILYASFEDGNIK